ncbi:MAG: iron-containing alcohol dehydrogenase, partial [Ilumatobacteraceae bacterium]
GTGIAHSIGHALGSLGHVPHGLAVAVGLAAALPWNVAGAPDSFAVAGATLGVGVDAVPDRYAELLAAASLGVAVRRVGPIDVDPDRLAAAMADDANQPMLRNNCREADELDRHALAAATTQIWNRVAG